MASIFGKRESKKATESDTTAPLTETDVQGEQTDEKVVKSSIRSAPQFTIRPNPDAHKMICELAKLRKCTKNQIIMEILDYAKPSMERQIEAFRVLSESFPDEIETVSNEIVKEARKKTSFQADIFDQNIT